MFTFMLDVLREHGKGVHGYRNCVNEGLVAATRTPEQASPFFILATAAADFIESHERVPLSLTEAESAFVRYSGYVEQLEAAYEEGTATAMLSAMNAVAGSLSKAQE